MLTEPDAPDAPDVELRAEPTMERDLFTRKNFLWEEDPPLIEEYRELVFDENLTLLFDLLEEPFFFDDVFLLTRILCVEPRPA